MKTTSKTESIEIPAVNDVPAFTLDPQNRAQVLSLIQRADCYFRLAATAWVRGNNSGDPALLRIGNKRCGHFHESAEQLLAPLGIKCSYPGLYPSFEVNGLEEMTTLAAVLAALGHPRNWLKSN